MPTDFLQALRSLWKRPLQSMIVAALVSVGVGGSSALYSVQEPLLWRPASYDPTDRLVDIGQRLEPSGAQLMHWHQNLNALRERTTVLDGVSVYKGSYATLATPSGPKYGQGMAVDQYLFPLLGVSPLFGRSFATSDEQIGAPCTIIFSHQLWRRNFAGDPSSVGSKILLDDKVCTVIGVMPQSFSFPLRELAGADADFWVSLQDNPLRKDFDKYGIGRIKPGRTLKEAQAEAAILSAHLTPGNTGHEKQLIILQHYRDVIITQYVPMLHLFAGVVACLLLVVCVNTAGLLLVECMRNRKDFEIRFALGGTQWQITRVFLLRVLALALAGALGGTGLAVLFLRLAPKFLADQLPHPDEIVLNIRILCVAGTAALGAGILSGVWPAMALTRKLTDLSPVASAHGASFPAMARSRRYLVMLQLAVSTALVTVTGFLGISLYRLVNADSGMQLYNRLALVVKVTDYDALRADALRALFSGIQQQLLSTSGVENVAVSSDVPLGPHANRDFRLRDLFPSTASDEWIAQAREVSPNYFRTLGIPMRLGRSFGDEDRAGAKPVAIVNELFAKRFLEGKNPLGTQMCVPSGAECLWREIVGVVANVRDTRVDEPPKPAYFLPFSQAPKEFLSDAVFTLLTVERPMALQKSIRVPGLASHILSTAPFPLEQIRALQTAGPRTRLPILAVAAILALLLAAMGVYGIVATTVESSRREIGIRMAVGASPQAISSLFVRKMFATLAQGLFIGTYGAALIMRFFNSSVSGISEIGLATYCGAALVVSVAAALATFAAVHRAVGANAAENLRTVP